MVDKQSHHPCNLDWELYVLQQKRSRFHNEAMFAVIFAIACAGLVCVLTGLALYVSQYYANYPSSAVTIEIWLMHSFWPILLATLVFQVIWLFQSARRLKAAAIETQRKIERYTLFH